MQCDLEILYERCLANNFETVVEKKQSGNWVNYYVAEAFHIDLYSIYRKLLVKNTIYHSAYRTNKLDDVSKTLLGYGKYKDLSGKDFQALPLEEQRRYSLQDSKLVMDISKNDNYAVLDAMFAISEITGLAFDRVCKTDLSPWWATLFNQMIANGETTTRPIHEFDKSGKQYKGALVLEPKFGLYSNIIVVDAASLYPTVSILYNISFDTINCECCKKDSICKNWS